MKIGMNIFFKHFEVQQQRSPYVPDSISYYSVLFPGRINGLVNGLYLGIGISETRVNIKSIMI